MDSVNLELSNVVDEVGELLLMRDWESKGLDVVDKEIESLIKQFEATDLNHLSQLVNSEFKKSRSVPADTGPNVELTEQYIREELKRMEELSDQKKSNLNKQFHTQSKINKLMETEDAILDARSDSALEAQRSKIISKNVLMSNFITDLISSLSSIDISSHDDLIEMILDCGDYSMYV